MCMLLISLMALPQVAAAAGPDWDEDTNDAPFRCEVGANLCLCEKEWDSSEFHYRWCYGGTVSATNQDLWCEKAVATSVASDPVGTGCYPEPIET